MQRHSLWVTKMLKASREYHCCNRLVRTIKLNGFSLQSHLVVPNKEPGRMYVRANTSTLLLQTRPTLVAALTSHPTLLKWLWQWQRVPCSEQTENSAHAQLISAVLAAELWFWLQYSYTSFKEGGMLTGELTTGSTITSAFFSHDEWQARISGMH